MVCINNFTISEYCSLTHVKMSDQFGPITLKWDPKNLEIRTMSVEKTLEPLVMQVTTLVNTKGPSKKKKGKSKRASALVGTVEKATSNFIEKGEQIAYENPDITAEMLSAVEEVRKSGGLMSIAARYVCFYTEYYFHSETLDSNSFLNLML